MTITLDQLLLYACGMAVLWVIPGPVWVALTARALSGGMAGAWPLAVGVALGDLIWPLCAVFGLTWVLSVYGGFLEMLRWVASGVFVAMGVLLIRKPAEALTANSRLTKPGIWPGFAVGVAAVIGNPKAILFYMGVLPGFFDLSRVTGWDIAAIISVSATVPMLGNLGLALSLDRARRLLSSPAALRRLNIISGGLLLAVACVIPFV
jgi:threonine/homoserine/homoserine lactone efflux protein